MTADAMLRGGQLDLSKLFLLRETTSELDFGTYLKYPVLLDLTGDDAGTDVRAGFFTEAAAKARAEGGGPRGVADSLRLLPVAKGGSNPYADLVSVGRTRNCDIWLNHHSVSKLHAQFVGVDGRYELRDAGSKNGTFLNGELLPPRTSVPLGDDCVLVFGTRTLRYATPRALYALLPHIRPLFR